MIHTRKNKVKELEGSLSCSILRLEVGELSS